MLSSTGKQTWSCGSVLSARCHPRIGNTLFALRSGTRSTNRGEGRLGNVAGLAAAGILNFGESKGDARAGRKKKNRRDGGSVAGRPCLHINMPIGSFAHDLMRCDNKKCSPSRYGSSTDQIWPLEQALTWSEGPQKAGLGAAAAYTR